MLSLKGDLDKKTKGTPKSFERSLHENTAILETSNLRSTGNKDNSTCTARALSYCNRSLKMKVQHHKQQRSSKKNVCSSDQKTMHRKLTKLGFSNALQAIVMLISWIAWSGLCV